MHNAISSPDCTVGWDGQRRIPGVGDGPRVLSACGGVCFRGDGAWSLVRGGHSLKFSLRIRSQDPMRSCHWIFPRVSSSIDKMSDGRSTYTVPVVLEARRKI